MTLHDIRGPVNLPDSPDWLFWLLPLLAVLMLVALFFFFRRRKKTKPPAPLAHQVALAELDRLRPLMNPAQAPLYADRLAELLRRYLEARFQIPSTRRTTSEFLLDLDQTLSSGSGLETHRDRLRRCLEQCDLSKFAHFSPDRQGLEAMDRAVRDFVMATAQSRPEPERR